MTQHTALSSETQSADAMLRARAWLVEALQASEIQSMSRRCRPEPIWDLRAAIKMPRNAVLTTSDGGAVLGENGEIAG
jgi:hypothetical protein